MKTFLLALSVLAIVTFSSCKKTYTCQCVNNSTNAVTTVTVKASNSNDAGADCAAETMNGTVHCGY